MPDLSFVRMEFRAKCFRFGCIVRYPIIKIINCLRLCNSIHAYLEVIFLFFFFFLFFHVSNEYVRGAGGCVKIMRSFACQVSFLFLFFLSVKCHSWIFFFFSFLFLVITKLRKERENGGKFRFSINVGKE